MSITATAPTPFHVGADELPWVNIGGGTLMRVLHVNEQHALWIVQNIFRIGFVLPTHRHTGEVWAFTIRGAWKYKEGDAVNRANSFLYEPANSVHTFECVEDDTLAWFHVTGMNLNLDADGNVMSVTDGASILADYYRLCEAQDLPRPNIVTV